MVLIAVLSPSHFLLLLWGRQGLQLLHHPISLPISPSPTAAPEPSLMMDIHPFLPRGGEFRLSTGSTVNTQGLVGFDTMSFLCIGGIFLIQWEILLPKRALCHSENLTSPHFPSLNTFCKIEDNERNRNTRMWLSHQSSAYIWLL